jgi:hypothetical protein
MSVARPEISRPIPPGGPTGSASDPARRPVSRKTEESGSEPSHRAIHDARIRIGPFRCPDRAGRTTGPARYGRPVGGSRSGPGPRNVRAGRTFGIQAPIHLELGVLNAIPRRVEVWRGSLGRSLFSPVGPPFRLRVSHHLDLAPSPHPAHRTGRADLPHPALGQDSSLPSLTNRSRAEACGASPVPGPGTGDGSGIVRNPASAPCASHITSDGAVPPRGCSPPGRLGPLSRG